MTNGEEPTDIIDVDKLLIDKTQEHEQRKTERIKKAAKKEAARDLRSSAEDKKAKREAAALKAFDAEYASGKFADREYLFEAFKGTDDLPYLKNLVVDCEKNKYPKSPLLNEYLFIATINHRMHVQYALLSIDGGLPDKCQEMLAVLDRTQLRLKDIEKVLTEASKEKDEGKSITALHQDVLNQAAKFVRQNAGSFSFKCEGCGNIVQANGLPHWALFSKEIDGTPFVFVWSAELWQLVLEKTIRPAHMAFVLRTGMIGVKYTCEARGETFPAWIDMAAEEAALKKMQDTAKFAEQEKQDERVKLLGRE